MGDENPFEIYGVPENCVLEAPNWTFEGDHFRRSDSAKLARGVGGWFVTAPDGQSSMKLTPGEVGSMDDIDALIAYDRQNECPAPVPAIGQVWCDGSAEFSVMTILREPDRYEVELSFDNDHVYSFNRRQAISIALLAGPGAPWVSSEWYDRGLGTDGVDPAES